MIFKMKITLGDSYICINLVPIPYRIKNLN